MPDEYGIRSYNLNQEGTIKLQRFFYDSKLWLRAVLTSGSAIDRFFWWSMEDELDRLPWDEVGREIKRKIRSFEGSDSDKFCSLRGYYPKGWGFWGLGSPDSIRKNDVYHVLNDQVFEKPTSELL